MTTNGSALVRNADASRGAARPNADTPRPPISATRSVGPSETRTYADAQHEQNRRIIVEAIERDPGDATILGVGPLISNVDLP